MIRGITLLILLATASVSLAQPLYKWVEADGSITFSPRKPAAGVEYETVKAASGDSQIVSRVSSPGAAAAPVQTAPDAAEPDVPDTALPRMEYAPGGNNDLPAAISRSPAADTAAVQVQGINTGIAVSPRLSSEAADEVTAESAGSVSAASYKQSRCQDLKKRVTSLERRLKSRLTPEDMDNTVIHMARYQQSFDQHCAQ